MPSATSSSTYINSVIVQSTLDSPDNSRMHDIDNFPPSSSLSLPGNIEQQMFNTLFSKYNAASAVIYGDSFLEYRLPSYPRIWKRSE
ncbi:MAG: hypothetical protein IPI10_14660 [Bacteroidetes bacterium]|nr:hypothetical protein [Bacteroidota bacterium]